jgi:hypothetical protein
MEAEPVMNERDRIKELFQAAANEHRIHLEVVLNPRSPGWYLDLTWARLQHEQAAERWESLVGDLARRCGQVGHVLAGLRSEAKIDRRRS